jgi:hypothetical protein
MANTNVLGFNIAFRRGNTTQNSNYTGPDGTISIDITKKQLRYHDGVTPGGFSLNTSVGTADKLSTPRNINGVSFDGSADINIVDSTKIPISAKDTNGGVAGLDSNKKITENYIPTTLFNNYIFDYTTTTATSNPNRVTNGIIFTHANVFTNTDPYGSGAIKIISTGYRSNQPLLYLIKDTLPEDGNSTQLVLENKGTGNTSTIVSDCAIEMVSKNANTGQANSARNGKMKIRVVGGNGGTSNISDGYGEIMFRRGPLHASGDNSGFEVAVKFRPITTDGLVTFYGTGCEIAPTYTNGGALFTIDNPYNTSRIELNSTASDYTLSSVWMDLKSNSSANASTPNTGQFRLLSSGTTGRFEFRDLNNGNVTVLDYQQGNGGIFSFYSNTDPTQGSIRVGNNTRNMKMSGLDCVINFSSNKSSTDTRVSVEGYFVKTTRINGISPTEGGTFSLTSYASQEEVCLFNTATNFTAFTVNLPNITPKEGQVVVVSTRQGTLAGLTFTSSLSGVTFHCNNPSKLAAYSSVAIMYRTNGNAWIVIKEQNINRSEMGVANGVATLGNDSVVPFAQTYDFFKIAVSATTLNFGTVSGEWTVSVDGSGFVNVRRNLNNSANTFRIIQKWVTNATASITYSETQSFSGVSNIIISKDNAGTNKAMVASTVWTMYLLDTTTTSNPHYKIEITYFASVYNLHVSRID